MCGTRRLSIASAEEPKVLTEVQVMSANVIRDVSP